MVILSQDKTQMINFDNVKNIWMTVMNKSNRDEDAKFYIVADDTLLGEYGTEERAKEVLLEIATHNATFNLFKCLDVEKQKRALEEFLEKGMMFDIYEMPEK